MTDTTTITTPVREYAIRRILRHYDAASTDDHRYGRTWYDDAHVIAREVATILDLPTRYGAGIVAALSPRNPWSHNVAQALDLARGRTITGLSLHIGRAERIAAGEEPDDVLGGPKVISFADNINRPEDSEEVTGDVWASRALFPRGTPPKLVEKWLKRVHSYAFLVDVYRAAARRRGIRPLEMQAVVWCKVRGGAA